MTLDTAPDGAAPGTISVPLAITLGLVASFIQSLGLTIQRKSHIHNESLPTSQRRTDWRRPMWVIGFVTFFTANLGGTLFQIGALPIVILAPLGAVSLLYNALLARFLLDDFFSAYMLVGTLLIAAGAVLIGYFGVVQEPPHDLDRLMQLFARPPFVAFVTVFVIAFVGVLFIAHLAEWSLHTRILREGLPSSSRRSSSRRRKGDSSGGRRMQRSWSAPHLAPLVEVSESSSGVATPALAIADEAARRGLPIDRLLANGRHKQGTQQQPQSIDGVLASAQGNGAKASAPPAKNPNSSPSPRRDYGTLPASTRKSHRSKPPRLDMSGVSSTSGRGGLYSASHHENVVARTKLGLAITYGGASGTLSGACLLLAKSGVELVVLSLAGQNQFNRWPSFALIGTLLGAAVLQLWYLNKGLKLADPTLLCPLAFCFYNTSSIVLGLVYFDQLGALSTLSISMVVLGTVVLLSGVWIVSMHGRSSAGASEGEETQPLLVPSDSTGSVGSSAASESMTGGMTSPTDSSFIGSPTEMEAVLGSNVAGIGGPHLPPVGGSTGAQDGDASSAVASPLTGSPVRYRGLKRRHARSFSSASGFGGLGLAIPSFGNDRDGAQEEEEGPLLPTTAPHVSASTSANGEGVTSPSALASPSSPHRKRTRRMLYRSLLERGLSIGIGVSSPGFQLRSVLSPEEEEEVEEEMRNRGWWGGARAAGRGRGGRSMIAPEQRRTMSEADIGSAMGAGGLGVALDGDGDGGMGTGRGSAEMQRAVTEGTAAGLRGRGHWFGALGRRRDGGHGKGAERRTSPLGRAGEDNAIASGDEEEDVESQPGEEEEEEEEQRTAPSSAWYLGGGGLGGGTQQQQQATTAYSRMGATLDLSALSARLGELGEGAKRRGWRLLGRGGREEEEGESGTDSPNADGAGNGNGGERGRSRRGREGAESG